jgi:hypothetical protein
MSAPDADPRIASVRMFAEGQANTHHPEHDAQNHFAEGQASNTND